MNGVIKVENLGKKYIIGHQKQRGGATLRDTMTHTARGIWQRMRHPLSPNRESVDLEELWALKDVNFEVQQGERIGIIGPNGAGKSTLLKILSRITEPTTGKVRIKGRVSSLLEVGTGFHPELTGRENVFLNGAILGMTRWEIRQKFDEIVAFAELEKFLDTPVKRYSSGMHVRLGFAVAAHLEPEILIVDEVLAVGDASFQKKCLGKMQNVAQEGRTVLFVSHNMASIENLCETAYLLKQGTVETHGPARAVIDQYLRGRAEDSELPLSERTDRAGSGGLRFQAIEFRVKDEEACPQLVCGQPFVVSLHYMCVREIKNPVCTIVFYNLRGNRIIHLSTKCKRTAFGSLPPRGALVCCVDALPLVPGEYSVNVALSDSHGVVDHIEEAARVSVAPADVYRSGYLPSQDECCVFCEHSWHLREET